jgi:hypothetical protein
MPGSPPRSRLVPTITIASILIVVSLASCGGEEPGPPANGFAAALASVGGGGEHGSLGVGWVDERAALRLPPPTRTELERALGPNAASVLKAAPKLRRRFGFEPDAATALVSLGGSYAFGLRLDGVEASGLRRALVAAGGVVSAADGVRLLGIGGYAEVPRPLLAAGVSGLGARDAFAPDRTVLAISETARASLLGLGDSLLEQPDYAAAASCLGNVIAARLIPDVLVLSTDLHTDLIAVGIARPPGGGRPRQEVLCLLGGTAADAGRHTAALRDTLAPMARVPRLGEVVGRRVTTVKVERPDAAVEAVRARLGLAAGARPGFLFDLVAAGALPALLGEDR